MDYQAHETVDCQGHLVMPGLVNAHTHAPMTLLRGLADDLRLDVWLMGYMMPVEREFVRPDFVPLGTRLACAEMIRSGTTCFADMYYFEEAVAEATAEAGVRALCGQTVFKFPSPDAASFEDSLAYAREFITRWQGHPLIVPGVAPHAPYTCTVEILRACAELAAEFDVPLHTHVAETAFEVEQSRQEHGMPVVPWVKKQRLFDARVLAAHCVHVDEGEMRTLKDAGAGVAHNPTSNLKLGSGDCAGRQDAGAGGGGGHRDRRRGLEQRPRHVRGDPAGSALGQRHQRRPDGAAGAAGARHGDANRRARHSPRRSDRLARARQASRPDRHRLDQTHNVPRFAREPDAVYSQLVYAAKSTDVVDMMCDGRWLMRDRRLLTLDEDELREAAQDVASRIDTFLIQREQSVLQKLIAIGGAVEQESFEVQVKARLASADPCCARWRAIDYRDPASPLPSVRHLLLLRRSRLKGVCAIGRTSFWMSRIRSSTHVRGSR